VEQAKLQDPTWKHTYSLLEHCRLAAAQAIPDRTILFEQTLRLCEEAIDAHCRRFCPDQAPRLKTVLQRRFVEGESLERIARSLHLTRGRVWQLETKIVALARKKLAGRGVSASS
jgi:DNA-directed RNA polymerase sigma subunit (sigma70/sigma32)